MKPPPNFEENPQSLLLSFDVLPTAAGCLKKDEALALLGEKIKDFSADELGGIAHSVALERSISGVLFSELYPAVHKVLLAQWKKANGVLEMEPQVE